MTSSHTELRLNGTQLKHDKPIFPRRLGLEPRGVKSAGIIIALPKRPGACGKDRWLQQAWFPNTTQNEIVAQMEFHPQHTALSLSARSVLRTN